MPDKHLLDTGITCMYDGDAIEYMDLVIVVTMVKPYIQNGTLMFYDMMTEDKDDYLYEPVFFHGKNWDEVEEQLEEHLMEVVPVEVSGAILNCTFCKSGILPGETTGVGLAGEVHRSQRNPDLKAYGNHFERLDVLPTVLCVACMASLNDEIQELWPDGVCHDDECPKGTAIRCWRQGCASNCPDKNEQ